MKRTFVLVAMLVAGSAGAEGFPCSEPQYAFLKEASKAEMQEEYCRLTRKAISNRASFKSTQQMIDEKRSLKLYSPKDSEMGMQELSAAHTCEVAAGGVSDALFRRFKTKPPKSCT